MAYEKQTWTTGEVITEEKLNHMEDGIENAYELPSVTETDNGKVLGVEDGAWSVADGGGDAGYECAETVTELFNETVTATQGGSSYAEAYLAYSQPITVDTLIVTFDGVEYTCERQETGSVAIYGAPDPSDFSEFPFSIVIGMPNGNMLATETAGEHTVKADSASIQVESMTPCFKKAVETLISEVVPPVYIFDITLENGSISYSQYPSDIATALNSGRVVVARLIEDDKVRATGNIGNITDHGVGGRNYEFVFISPQLNSDDEAVYQTLVVEYCSIGLSSSYYKKTVALSNA